LKYLIYGFLGDISSRSTVLAGIDDALFDSNKAASSIFTFGSVKVS